MTYRRRVFDVLGMDELEERVYRFLLADPSSSIGKIAAKVGGTRSRIDSALRALEQRGFVQRSAADPRAFLPVAPEEAIEGPLQELMTRIQSMREDALKLTQRLQGMLHPAHPADVVEALADASSLAERWRHLIRSAKTETLNFDRPPYASSRTTTMQTAWGPDAVGRIIFDQAAIASPARVESFRERRDANTSARLVPELPMKLLIVDRRVALVGLVANDTVAGGLVIHESALLDGLGALFESYWQRAVPIEDQPAVGTAQLEEERNRILGLLAAGLTDHAIARALGVSRSTVVRRLRELATELGANSRFQMCYFAIERGWIDPRAPGG